MVDQARIDAAYKEGLALSRLTGFDTMTVFNPYDADEQPELWDAWDEGFNADSDIRSELIHFGV